MQLTLSSYKTDSAQQFIPYGRQHITENDIEAVVRVLRSDFLTQGPAIERFEKSLAEYAGAPEAVACANGTAALHLAMLALRIGQGDIVVTTPNTFLADANCARYVDADITFADIDPETGLMDPESLAEVLSKDKDGNIKAVIPVHFAGQPCDLPAIYQAAKKHGAWVIDDACHALGGSYRCENRDYRLGGTPHSDMTVFSFHPVKHVAMGEGGAVTTANTGLAKRLRRFRNHGMQREEFVEKNMAKTSGGMNPWYYEMQELGFNYRLTEIQAALGTSQLQRLSWSLTERARIARTYDDLIVAGFPDRSVTPLQGRVNIAHAYHLYVVQIDFDFYKISRAEVMNQLRQSGIGTQVHYIPIHLQPYYRALYDTGEGDFPNAENYYSRALSLPMYPDLTDEDCQRIIAELKAALEGER